MSSSKEYLMYTLEKFSLLENITYKSMMGQYILYYQGKIFGGIYNNQVLLKPIPSALAFFSFPKFIIPYTGAKEMLLLENMEDKEFLQNLIKTMYKDLPEPKKAKIRKKNE